MRIYEDEVLGKIAYDTSPPPPKNGVLGAVHPVESKKKFFKNLIMATVGFAVFLVVLGASGTFNDETAAANQKPSTRFPTSAPAFLPTFAPTVTPSQSPTSSPSSSPSESPTPGPTQSPTTPAPTRSPTTPVPTSSPTTSFPTESPTFFPTNSPSFSPTHLPTESPTFQPTSAPSFSPTFEPTKSPTTAPTFSPSLSPTTTPTLLPTVSPTQFPTFSPTVTGDTRRPTLNPTTQPSTSPSVSPSTTPSISPSLNPTTKPSLSPSESPSLAPSKNPTVSPSTSPTKSPTSGPTTSAPSQSPSASPTTSPVEFQFPVEERVGNGFIGLFFFTQMDEVVKNAFLAAATRWNNIVEGTTVPSNVVAPSGSSFCGVANFKEDTTVDHLLIAARIGPLDGEGKVLASAGPCALTTLPVLGLMSFDEADIGVLVAQGTLEAVILHEMGHVLGIGSVWRISTQGAVGGNGEILLKDPVLDSSGKVLQLTTQPKFTGVNAVNAYSSATKNSETFVPVEDGTLNGAELFESRPAGRGSIDAHWDEDFMPGELMEFRLDTRTDSHPLSAISIASLQDLGYTVDLSLADEYSPTAARRSRLRGSIGIQIDLSNDILDLPLTVLKEI